MEQVSRPKAERIGVIHDMGSLKWVLITVYKLLQPELEPYPIGRLLTIIMQVYIYIPVKCPPIPGVATAEMRQAANVYSVKRISAVRPKRIYRRSRVELVSQLASFSQFYDLL